MKKNVAIPLFVLVGHLFGIQVAWSSDVIEVAIFTTPPKIDGRLDEPVWEEAARLEDFVQVEPDPGAPATERTQLLIGYDEQKLYVGVRCYESDPEKINSVMLSRDTGLQNEDAIQLVFDTFLDGRTAFYFAVNPVGAQIDALIRGDGDDVSTSWDGVWFSATSRDESGWTAEIAIPFKTLRFPQNDVQTWGFNVMRSIIHKREYVVWKAAGVPNPSLAILKVSAAGRLTGLRNLKPGRGLEVKPYVLASAEENDTREDDESFEVGIDVRKSLTSDLTLDLTYNLDFAEAEADNQQVNLTRFKLFFPEKRDFFLENASLFYFGDRQDDLRSPQMSFFFSRQIGLTEDRLHTIPVLGGAKLSGRLGGMNVGFLNLTADELTYRDRDGEERFEPQTNYTVVRLKKDVLKRSSVGLMWLNKEARGGADNSGAGIDWDFGLGKHLRSGGFVARTSTPGTEGDDWAGIADVVWESERFFGKASYSDIGDDFNPEMGFFTRLGVRELRGYVGPVFRPKLGSLRGIWVSDEYVRVTDQDGNLETEHNRLYVDVVWNNWVAVSLKVFDETEVLVQPFEIHPGVVLAPGRYGFKSYFVGFQTVPGKPVFFFGRIQTGDFYDGTATTLVAGWRLRPSRGLFSRIFYEHNDVELPAGDFSVDLLSVNVTYSVSPRLSGRALVEWQSDDNLSANVAVKWTYRPGAAFYLVYNELHDLFGRPGSVADPVDRSLAVKTTFFF